MCSGFDGRVGRQASYACAHNTHNQRHTADAIVLLLLLPPSTHPRHTPNNALFARFHLSHGARHRLGGHSSCVVHGEAATPHKLQLGCPGAALRCCGTPSLHAAAVGECCLHPAPYWAELVVVMRVWI